MPQAEGGAVTATTGKAAFNIQDVTIHSLLLPVGVYGNKDLSGESLGFKIH